MSHGPQGIDVTALHDPSMHKGWRAILVRLGHRRMVLGTTLFSILIAVPMSGAMSYFVYDLHGEQLVPTLVISFVVACVAAPLVSNLSIRLFFELEDARATCTGEPLALLMIDADEFKAINDRHGHATGDRALQQIARACTECVRTNDVVARYGGEEFVVLMPGVTTEQACEIAEGIRVAVSRRRVDSAVASTIGVTVSIGVATLEAPGMLAPALLERADAALYEAKRAGRNRWIYRGCPQG
jgi:diguanylate cyclase (GGDEF)-like protein